MFQSRQSFPARISVRVFSLIVILICALVAVVPACAQVLSPASVTAQTTSATASSSVPSQGTIPPGTILPVILRTSFSPDKIKTGQLIHGEIAQDVPFPDGSRIRKGSKVEGHIVEVTLAANGDGAKVSLKFDKLYSRGQAIPIITNLRAFAGFMEIQAAGIPTQTNGEGEVAAWLDTMQVGGDSVYGVGGPVMSSENPSLVVGKAVNDGVLVQVRAKEGTKCRGPLNGNNNPQAMWVFSSDACGIYGMEKLKLAHSGRTEPVGTIVFESKSSHIKLRSGDGLLLRVIG